MVGCRARSMSDRLRSVASGKAEDEADQQEQELKNKFFEAGPVSFNDALESFSDGGSEQGEKNRVCQAVKFPKGERSNRSRKDKEHAF